MTEPYNSSSRKVQLREKVILKSPLHQLRKPSGMLSFKPRQAVLKPWCQGTAEVQPRKSTGLEPVLAQEGTIRDRTCLVITGYFFKKLASLLKNLMHSFQPVYQNSGKYMIFDMAAVPVSGMLSLHPRHTTEHHIYILQVSISQVLISN